MLAYELWETESGSLMASFDTEAEARAAVARRVARYGPESVATLSLVSVDEGDEDEDIVTVASGTELLVSTALPPADAMPASSRGRKPGKSSPRA